MGWNNPPIPWSQLEQTLSRGVRPQVLGGMPADGGDGPAFSRKRAKFRPEELVRPEHTVPYAELHAHSHYSFLDGASSPEDMVAQAARLGLREAHAPPRLSRAAAKMTP